MPWQISESFAHEGGVVDLDDGSFNFYGRPMKHVRFFFGCVLGIALTALLTLVIGAADAIFSRDSSSLSGIIFLGLLGLFCGKLSLKGEKLRDLEFWEGWGMLLGIFTTILAAKNFAFEPVLKSGAMSALFVFGRWLEMEKIKKSR